MKVYIGIDDTDSRTKGLCTTYLAFKLIHMLKNHGFKIIEDPLLVRLNPNVPFKTRGNGSVRLAVELSKSSLDELIDLALEALDKYSIKDDEQTNPGLVIIDQALTKDFSWIYYRALRSFIEDPREIIEFLEEKALFYKYYGNARGIIGASAACGATFYDYTYELLLYRTKDRAIDENSVIEMDKKYYPLVFDNYDYERGIVLITPRGPDPVYLGIRGETKEVLNKAFSELRLLSPYEGYCIFKTNQATDAHITSKRIKDIRPYDNVRIVGRVVKPPEILPGSHVKFTLDDGTGQIDCMAYFETGKRFRKIVSNLAVDDLVEIYGGISKYENTVNLEKIKLLRLTDIYVEKNPKCPICGKSMHSLGRGKGFKCKKCGTKAKERLKEKIERTVATGFYDVAPNARRHLSKPLCRYGSEKSNKI